MKESLITVVIPTFNRAAYVIDTLTSIAKQTYTNFECLIIDDGSVDGTEEIVLTFCKGDSRFIYMRRPENLSKGVNSCRNLGVSKSTGSFIAFCDDDDFWIPKKLEIQMAIFNANPETFVVTGDIEYVNKRGVKTNVIKSHWPDNHGYVFKNFLIKNRTSMITPMLRSEVFNKVGSFNTHFVIAEDWEFWRRVSFYYQFYSVNSVLAYVRLHTSNISNTRTGEPLERFQLYRDLTKSLLKWGNGRFNKTDCNLILKIEWNHYHKIMVNHYPGILNKIKFFKQVFVCNIMDGIHLIFLLIKFHVLNND